ncbi:unnamed protein product [Clonostachys solani]|uniref:Barwin domain-containing protein n=1 Tax=Clonostachys solani TaxID=160281 RepID=A0A9N9W841_9HYPO|nr:unnamed protein product [Clonostachys solani]
MVSVRQFLFTFAASTAVFALPTPQEVDVKFSNFQSIGLALPGDIKSPSKQAGAMTYYLPGQGVGNGFGACGTRVDFTQPIVAISGFDYGHPASGNPNDADICGHWIKITGRDSKKVAWAQVVDKCPEAECPPGFIDVSEVVFKNVTADGTTTAGRIQVDWEFVAGNGLLE